MGSFSDASFTSGSFTVDTLTAPVGGSADQGVGALFGAWAAATQEQQELQQQETKKPRITITEVEAHIPITLVVQSTDIKSTPRIRLTIQDANILRDVKLSMSASANDRKISSILARIQAPQTITEAKINMKISPRGIEPKTLKRLYKMIEETESHTLLDLKEICDELDKKYY